MANKIAVTKKELQVQYNPSWFLASGEYPVTGSFFTYLINGELAFKTLYSHIEQAKSSIEIAIWGFQPSMYFVRDGKSPNIGDLLIKKAMQGVKIRLLVWCMPLYIQTMGEANLGNAPGVFKASVTGATKAQKDYDFEWYLFTKFYFDPWNRRYNENTLRQPNSQKYPLIAEFFNSGFRQNLHVEFRSVASQSDSYLDKEISAGHALALQHTASHHQKTVLIDYETPATARGFILEHNMLDNYWTKTIPSVKTTAPNLGQNCPTPLQDVSSFLKGPILHSINHNFCQSWDKVSREQLLAKRQRFTANMYTTTKPIAIQALRTYDSPNVEDIKKIYLQNIKKTTSYIYTENQYFRWPPLVEEFKKHWQNMKAQGRATPIYWFVVTNSSDAGIGKGTVNTDRMFKALGRQDVMPEVTLSTEPHKSALYNQQRSTRLKLMEGPQYHGGNAGVASLSKDLTDIKNKYINNLKRDVSQEVGIKCHVCVLHALDSPAKQWQEIYIHSKVTMINDVFLTMGSANINTRSMQGDTEMNLALEHGQTVQAMRQNLWRLHVGANSAANPANMSSNVVAANTFKAWQRLINANNELRNKGKPKQALTEFLRESPAISNLD